MENASQAGAVVSPEALAGADLWVFGYGSLMWNPCFRHEEQQRGMLFGYHRALCILSVLNRGTAQRPGLALGLNRGGSCRGLVFRIPRDEVQEACADLWAREMAHAVYTPRLLPVRTGDGGRVLALTFIARPDHGQYVGDLPPERAAALVAQGRGAYGTALDYLRNVVVHLDAFGIVDPPLRRVLELAESLVAGEERARGERP